MIRTRFAPSPTGYLHVGGLRTALYCYLFAKKNKGRFLLRIEDTDRERFVEGALENLIDTLAWVGISYDEGPYIQSQRTEIYREHVQKLIDSGQAYRCFCTKERLDEMRENQTKMKMAPMYDRKCLDLPESEIQEKTKAGEKFVVRQKMPYELIKFKDLIRGNVQFDGKTIDDQVLMKSDGFPTYHLANVVDDHLMEITHVIRGEEWLPSTPKHIALYKAFGWQPPEFAHLPLLLNADRSKLSKRQGDVSVEDYIKKGYLKEAIINFVAFLGWNPGGGEEAEIFSLEELEEAFSIEKVHKAGAIFNLEKLDWFNWRWKKRLFNLELEKIAKEIDPQVNITSGRKDQLNFVFSKPENEKEFITTRGKKLLAMCNNLLPKEYSSDESKLLKALVTIEEKILKDPKETLAHLNFYFRLSDYPQELLTHVKMGVDLNRAAASLKAGKEDLEKLENWNLQTLRETLMKTVSRLGVKNGQIFWPLRAALSGLEFSPGVFELAWVLGKEETLKRIELAANKI
ncbi:glutamate--tRNA ligase [Candidatus Peregrinibacteria bacterium]|nr:glutamate--tRNA ligase [Candidatus Peregrinibacteria bacterium]